MFSIFKNAIDSQFKKMSKFDLFMVDIDKDLLWETYLNSFPPGTNLIFRERTEYDCCACRQFIKTIGGVVAIKDGKLSSIWDVKINDNKYQVVADTLSKLVKSKSIIDKFLYYKNKVGRDTNYEQLDSGDNIKWEHFQVTLPQQFVCKKSDIGGKLSQIRSTKNVFLRSLLEITIKSCETVLELIEQKSIYRGEEHVFTITEFLKLKRKFDKLNNISDQRIFCWSINAPISIQYVKNSAIGTLLSDISIGKNGLEYCVRSFENKVAPTNYKRPTTLITKSMIEKAKQKIENLGFTSALPRRFSVIDDITINNIMFGNYETKKQLDVFDELSNNIPDSKKYFNKVDNVDINTFINKILPKCSSIELMIENKHTPNLVSLISPVDINSKQMFKWNNNFSWTYNGNLTDSIKERVKQAGGDISGDLRCSLSWFNFDDLDIRMVEPDGHKVWFNDKKSASGFLDIDMNASSGTTRSAVENICYPIARKMQFGNYKLQVHNYQKRETIDNGFDIEIEFNGITQLISYTKSVKNNELIDVATIEYSNDGFKIIKSLPTATQSKEIWNINTEKFHTVRMIMNSPNHWDGNQTGNKHYFFIIENCINPEKSRGFFNEYLKEELNQHRKVLEVLGNTMKTPKSENQLSGVGFSSTQKNNILCRCKGNFERVIKLTF